MASSPKMPISFPVETPNLFMDPKRQERSAEQPASVNLEHLHNRTEELIRQGSTLTSLSDVLGLIKEFKEHLNELRHRSKKLEQEELPQEAVLKTRELESLLRSAKQVLEGSNFNVIARHIFAAAREMTGAPSGYIALLSPNAEEMEVLILESGGLPCTVDPDLPMPIRGLRADIFKSGRAVYENDFMNSSWVDLIPEGHVELRNVLFSPLNIDGETTGIIGLANKPGGFTEYDKSMTEAFGDLAAIALKNSRNLEALRRSERKFRTLVDNTIDWVWQVDEKGKYVYTNSVARTIIGYGPEELYKMTLFDLTGPGKGSRLEEILADPDEKRERIVSLEISMAHKKGRQVFFETNATPLFDDNGAFLGYFGTFRDITERKQAEEQLRKSHEELEKRVAERTSELEQQRLISMRTDRLRSLGTMAAGMAHELNQPLVGVRGLAEHMLLARKRGWPINEHQTTEKLKKIIEQADRMTGIIQHIRTFSQEAGKPKTQPVCVNEVIEASLELLRTQLQSRGIKLDLSLKESPPCVIANPFSLEEAILNCLINARDAIEDRIAASGDDDFNHRISLITYIRNKGRKRIVLEIADTGTGIPPEMLDSVYEPFFTTKGPDRGSGLGLSISKSIIESFGGEIDLKNREGRGTEVTISLPSENGGQK